MHRLRSVKEIRAHGNFHLSLHAADLEFGFEEGVDIRAFEIHVLEFAVVVLPEVRHDWLNSKIQQAAKS